MSFWPADRAQDLVDDGKAGWELRPALADAKPVNTKDRLRGLYPAGSRLKDDMALGGFGPCDNFPFELGDKDWGVKGKVALVTFPQEKVGYFKHQGIALRVINRSEKVAAFAAFDSMMYILQEAQDKQGRWREIELPADIHAFCGNSFHRVLLAPGQYWQFPARRYEGSFKTKIRFRLDPTPQPGEEPPIYSNEIEGIINLSQLRVGPDRAVLGKALHSAKATPEVVAALIEALGDDNKENRRRAASHLGTLGPDAEKSILALRTALQSNDHHMRAEAAAALFRIDNQPRAAIDTLSALVQGRDLDARRSALFALREIGPAAKDAVPALCVALLKEPDKTLRSNMAETLGEMRSRPDLCVPALRKTLNDSEWIVRSYTARALCAFGADAKEAVTALARALKDEAGHVRVSSAEALWRIEGKLDPALDILIGSLNVMKFNHDYVADAAAGVLGKMGPGAKAAVPALKKVLANEDTWRETRVCVAEAMWRITGEVQPTTDVFIPLLRDRENIRYNLWHLFTVLEEMGPLAKGSAPALRELLTHESKEARQAAANALKKIVP
jgi:HEAT repeat protein